MLSSLITMDSLSSDNPFLSENNVELIFSQGSLFSQIILSGYAPDFCVSEDLYRQYDTSNDYRALFFSRNGITDSLALTGKYYTGSHQSHVSDVLMLRSAEAYLNMAEDCAMMGTQDGVASQYLNALRRTRIRNYVDQAYTGEELVVQIRNERRKELCFEGHRWFDLRRYGMPSISHDYRTRSDVPWVTYTLREKDPLYTLPFPRDVMDSNMSLEQNASANEPNRVGKQK